MATVESSHSAPVIADAAQAGDATLLDLLDRLLDRGVVLHGDIRLAVADIALVRLSLSVLLAAEDTARGTHRPGEDASR